MKWKCWKYDFVCLGAQILISMALIGTNYIRNPLYQNLNLAGWRNGHVRCNNIQNCFIAKKKNEKLSQPPKCILWILRLYKIMKTKNNKEKRFGKYYEAPLLSTLTSIIYNNILNRSNRHFVNRPYLHIVVNSLIWMIFHFINNKKEEWKLNYTMVKLID